MNHSRVQVRKWAATSVGESCSRCGKCLTKMQLILLAVLLYSSPTTGQDPKIVRLDVPTIADPRWEEVTLQCEYDLGGKDLYSVKWFKDEVEFFRFMPSSTPVSEYFPVEGIVVDIAQSNGRQVKLLGQSNNRGERINLAGSYGCEVSSEAPSFRMTYAEANMSVAVLPTKPPVLDGFRPYYEIGEVLEVACTSALSYPLAVLTFILNGKEVDRAKTTYLPITGYNEEMLISVSRLSFSLRLERQHFPGGTLHLVCQSSLPDIPNVRAFKTEKTATLAASNQRLAQEAPKSASSTILVPSLTMLLCFLRISWN
ncbi:uncharacterized protein LOC124424483 isoform X1 [Vespa crabro]|uniref:uncharacterized protein LOC124424483 isoform X1 n=1 Tax=Vespa crabro TaxID=7445 RepID=UPI001F01E5E3|nr:uncharacterized protein LOC124424483 isoform X1 [Vespa crabro]XP_046819556.1 uncharacterized protein LOC124424483 isoform X1 [Vespa crabro]XP_046819566.1 uncharacterized protein LOC124424483 isoform X1 [Vespa crabro]XP_046819576.1 uncharacterized protein LOC124424483 isoform X1 [Vespa crabro]XP_046819587.1 uncharacterized protein LOC124424483 isoform X1 [Vespa crabro]